jgi:hypothetical protein
MPNLYSAVVIASATATAKLKRGQRHIISAMPMHSPMSSSQNIRSPRRSAFTSAFFNETENLMLAPPLLPPLHDGGPQHEHCNGQDDPASAWEDGAGEHCRC